MEEHGRYPDVYAEMEGLGKFAFEVQLSKPFIFEIAARHLHYEAEGISLIWVFHELADELPQGFRDVITAQRGNAFVFDQSAFEASVAADRLTLSAYWKATTDGSSRVWLPLMTLTSVQDAPSSSKIAGLPSSSPFARLVAPNGIRR